MPKILITGANRGLGLTGRSSEAGWSVHACCRNPGAATDLAAIASDGAVTVHALDVADFSATKQLAQELDGEAIDVLLNNAGIMMPSQATFNRSDTSQSLGHLDFEGWLEVLRINLLAPAHMAECFADQVARSDRKIIANTSSIMGSIEGNDSGGWYAYRTSKAAVNMLTRNLAHDLKDRGITAVSLHPGWVRTEMGGPTAALSPEESVAGLFTVLTTLTPAQSGRFIAWNGNEVAW
jgi:NAD(P)-dependent dehydrogenase (short-subunit alcohol dehydrogenase family)